MVSNSRTILSDHTSRRKGPTLLRRLERFLDGRTWMVLVLSPIIIASCTGYALWWFLASRHVIDKTIALGATTIVAGCIFLFGVTISLYLNTLFKRFNRLRAALNVVDAPLIIFDENRRVVQFNKSAFEYYEIRDTLLKTGMSESQLIEIEAQVRFKNSFEQQNWIDDSVSARRKAVQSGEPVTETFVKSADSASAQHQQILLAQLENGELAEMRTDVTALKIKEIALEVRERELEKSRDEAQASNRSKSEFLANMSHEIRTPMNGVVGMTELLLDSKLSTDQRLYASTVSTSAQSLLKLINDILDFSKIEAGKLELDPQAFDLRRMFDDVAAMLAIRTHTKGVELVMNYSPDLPSRFIGDQGRLRQIITNLAGNAVKFTDTGHVAIQVTTAADTDNNDPALATLRVDISDTGIGIPLDKQEQVFRMFEQVDGASNRRFEGSGLGLAISRRLLHLMNSDISLHSEPGVGSKFSFEIQLRTDKNQSPEQTTASPVALTGLKVLVVDDLPLNTEILSRRIQLWGMLPVVANSANEALKLAQNQCFDLALIDFQMPVMDGHELCKTFKANPALAEIPIILVSSVDQSVQGERVRELGFADTMVKPVRTEVLFEKITKVLANGQLDVEDAPNTRADDGNEVTSINARSQSRSDARVLVVEDNMVNQMVIIGLLNSFGISPEIANNGQEGLDSYSEHQPDLVFMDVSMPVMNGMEATHAIRDLELETGKPRCPIVALTANAMKGDRERCIESGMDDFLSKPVLLEDLSMMLDRWIDQPQNQTPQTTHYVQGF